MDVAFNTAKSQIGGTITGGTCWKTFEEECMGWGMKRSMERVFEAINGLVMEGTITEEIAATKIDMTLAEYREANRHSA